jgi:Domain of unknown function (DUF4331)
MIKAIAAIALLILVSSAKIAGASDHLDSPATVANPQADIADVYAWASSDGKRLNLAMTIQGHSFSPKIDYAIHIDSGKKFGQTSESTAIACQFSAPDAATCQLGQADSASGDPTRSTGLESGKHRFRVFAALRDDPFYNNIKGLVTAYGTASGAIKNGASVDAAGCATFDAATVKSIHDQMGHTEAGPAQNFLFNWTVSAIVISVDIGAVATGGRMLAVWGTTSIAGKRLDRMARPFVGNTLLGIAPFSTDDASGTVRQQYNEALPGDWAQFVAVLEKGLAFQDSLDGKCGNQVLAAATETAHRYQALAKVFADDRLWVNTAFTVCTQFLAVELASLTGEKRLSGDCGGRTPTYDTSNTWRSLLIAGTSSGVTDGLQQDEHPPSSTVFPFLAPPDANGIDH